MTRIGNLRPHRPARRLTQLYTGLVLYGVSTGLMIQSHLGSMPWDVLHQGIARRTGLAFGWVSIGVGAVVLLFWIPLRQRPGLGTISNVLVIGPVADRTLAFLPVPHPIAARAGLLVAGIVLNGLAGGLYIGASYGPGPRDGLMTGLSARTGRSIRLVRTGIEVVVVVAGAVLGGVFNVGTVLYALTIGPLVQLFLPWFTIRRPAPGGVAAATTAAPIAPDPAPGTPDAAPDLAPDAA
ncbi:membrane protein YczE [Rugosimonospora africana]|uniref:membrane protein YczE n=1 Tax=Rugosimonospora africana TaxID=556532 RepID=UPI001EF2D9E5|nr:hypothetical protein [Rugosimonospora africana]